MSTVATIHSEATPRGDRAGCQLVVHEGVGAGRAVPIVGKITVGTDAKNDLVLDDDRVSARHLEVEPDGAGFLVRDLDSTNGTLFEGSQLKEARVSVGATLKLGRTFIRIQPRPEPLDVPPRQSRRFGELVAESLVMR